MLGQWDRILEPPESDEDDPDEADGGEGARVPGELRTLTPGEVEKLETCLGALRANRIEDPKWRVLLSYLRDRGWAEDGCIQRIGQSRPRIRVLNLRYRDSVEDKVHKALAESL